MKIKLMRAKYLIPMTKSNDKLDRIEDGYILFKDKILEVGAFSEEIGKRLIEKYGNELEIIGEADTNMVPILNAAILPGFVKAHGHDHESTIIGIAKDEPLTVWLDAAVNPFTEWLHTDEKQLTDEMGISPYLLTYTKARVDDISFGITSALTHHCNFNKYHVNELASASEEVGTRVFIAVGSQDRNYYEAILDTVDEAISRLDKYYIDNQHLDRVTIIPGPDQFFSNGPELLKALKQWARDHNSLIHIHSSEEPNTTKWFTEKYGFTPVEYADSIEFLDEKTMLAHQVHSTKLDIEIMAKHNVMVVHNPLANTILGSGMPLILDMIKAGIRVSIATDGSGSADSQNMLSAARLASQYQKALNQDARVLGAEEVLQRITTIPAQMLGINAGSLETGKDADIIMIDLSKPNFVPTIKETVLENIIWASAGNEISHVFANGKALIQNYEFMTVDIEDINQQMQKLAEIFEDYREKASKIKGTGANV
jgi:5-methylthioadenosine/S-adenosylhomocysteine deaminase